MVNDLFMSNYLKLRAHSAPDFHKAQKIMRHLQSKAVKQVAPKLSCCRYLMPMLTSMAMLHVERSISDLHQSPMPCKASDRRGNILRHAQRRPQRSNSCFREEYQEYQNMLEGTAEAYILHVLR